MEKYFKCPFCRKKYLNKDGLFNHMEKEHSEELHGLSAMQIYFNFKNRYSLNKQFGKSVISGKPTPFNMITGRYERFANESERLEYRELFKKNMRKVYGKDTILDEPEQQKKMLANRHISGIYHWSDGKHDFQYTGSYEYKFLEFLDLYLGWENPDDIMMPAPQVFPWKDSEGVQHFHIPDCYLTSCNLIVNIKSSENQHYRLRDLDKEKLEDLSIEKTKKFNYIKIYDNDFDRFIEAIKTIESKPEKLLILESSNE